MPPEAPSIGIGNHVAMGKELTDDPGDPCHHHAYQKKREVLTLAVSILDRSAKEPEREHVEKDVLKVPNVVKKTVSK